MRAFSSFFVRAIFAAPVIFAVSSASADICIAQNDVFLDTNPNTPPIDIERIDFVMPNTGTLQVTTTIATNTVGNGDFLKIIQVNGENVAVLKLNNFLGVATSNAIQIPAGADVRVEYDIRGMGESLFDVAIDIAEGCGSSTPFVVDEFSESGGGGTGWAAGSNWGGNLDYLSDNAIEPRGPQHVRSNGALAFREFSPESITAIQSADEVWIGFLARFDRTKDINSFAGISIFSDAAERFFIGGGFSTIEWSLTFGFKDTAGERTSAEWSHVLIHVDYEAGRTLLYLNGRPRVNRDSVPDRNWDRVRITNGPISGVRFYVDNLKIGETREAVESPLPPLLYSSTSTTFRERNYGSTRDVGSLLYGTLRTFTTRLNTIRGMAADGQGRIFTGHSSAATVIAHDRDGNELFSWNAPATLQSMDVFDGQVMIGSEDGISFHDPDTGVVSRTLNNPCSSGDAPAGLAYDGTKLWAICGADIESLDPITGAPIGSLPNPAFNVASCPFGSQRVGMAATAPGELTIGCAGSGVPGTHGWRITTLNGATIDTTAQDLGDAIAVRPAILDPALFNDRFESNSN